jgi:23S rRNA (cytidine1920-2'-O)/16S rRNA (cytidine1409-2'-O)-methyltransferase
MVGIVGTPPPQIRGHVKIEGMANNKRVDQVLVERGLVNNLEEAKRFVMAGKVRHLGQVVMKASQKINDKDEIILIQNPKYVSRGGEKLGEAFEQFPLIVSDRVCADVGASTGGFTDCLLINGASKVYAVDVGYGILDWRLRNDPRVVVMERTNARSLVALPEPVDFITVDVSFISLKKILPVIRNWFPTGGGEVVVLIKPQFEATREEAARGVGVIRDPEIHQRILTEILCSACEQGYQINGLIRSPLIGPEGNTEFLTWLSFPGDQSSREPIQTYISSLF